MGLARSGFPVRIDSPAFSGDEAITEVWIDYGLVRPQRKAWRNIYALMGYIRINGKSGPADWPA
ncbi:MAG TPA: hypothetical protein DDW95_12025 [Alphaproteobacteria bacterium]|nr:hypothetical protein [Alphaproteobacteria bacterium]HBF99271.1 hypothetical protein [Alphaproteobacteria bacterium]HCO90853.1 hypothetical protein [Alphaproteobacteria bacterium]